MRKGHLRVLESKILRQMPQLKIRDQFKNQKEPKMKFVDFGSFQSKIEMPSHDRIIFHVLFGLFHITFRTPYQF